jgi:hypothetical protein
MVSLESHVVAAAQELTIVLQGNIPAGNKMVEALQKVSVPFTKIDIAKTRRHRPRLNQLIPSWGRRAMAVAGEVTRHGQAHPYSWSITIFSLSGLESDETNHRSEWKRNS